MGGFRLELVLPFKSVPRTVVHIADQPFLQVVFVFETRGSRHATELILQRFHAATEAAVDGNAGAAEGNEMDDVLTGVVFVTPVRHVVIVEGTATSTFCYKRRSLTSHLYELPGSMSPHTHTHTRARARAPCGMLYFVPLLAGC